MNGWDLVILAGIAIVVILALHGMRKRRGTGCHGNCAECAGCSAGSFVRPEHPEQNENK